MIMNSELIPYLIAIVILVTLSAYFSATETAFSSANRTRLKALAEKGNKRARQAYHLADDYDKLISTILIGNNIVNISLSSIGTLLFIRLYGDMGATISTVVITIVVLIFGEVSPKSIAKDCPEKFAMFSAPIIQLLIWVFTPVNFLFSAWKKLLSKVLKIQQDNEMSPEELIMLVDEIQQDGSIDKDEGKLLRNAIEFNDLEVEEILTHRVDIEAVPLDATKEEIAQVFAESKFSRLLVYSQNIDNIVGVIHQKDFYVASGLTDLPLEELITPPVFVLKNEKIDDLLRLLQKNKAHIAVVLDEYGGTYGIVTMEDILEELVGEIWDEHDEVTEEFKKLDDTTYLVDGMMDIEEFCHFFKIEADSDTTSLNGWIMQRLERVPECGDTFAYENLVITVTAIDFHRVTELRVQITPTAQPEAEEATES